MTIRRQPDDRIAFTAPVRLTGSADRFACLNREPRQTGSADRIKASHMSLDVGRFVTALRRWAPKVLRESVRDRAIVGIRAAIVVAAACFEQAPSLPVTTANSLRTAGRRHFGYGQLSLQAAEHEIVSVYQSGERSRAAGGGCPRDHGAGRRVA